MNQADIYFYYPEEVIVGPIPEADGRFVPERPGKYVWTVKTCGILQSLGFNCKLTSEIPVEGIIITHREFLPDDLKPNARQLFVCAIADMHRHPYAQLHIVQNPVDPMVQTPTPLWSAIYIPHWCETGLRARDSARGQTLKNVAYLGMPGRLAGQLSTPQFARQMQEHGFQFIQVGRDQWHDYTNIDAIIAVRSFAVVPFYKHPATKLYNAWLAGVPALLGHESAYQAERRSELDYFEVRSVDQILRTLERLRDDPHLRNAVEANCRQRAREVTVQQTAQHWIAFLDEVAVPAYGRWLQQNQTQMQHYFFQRKIAYGRFRIADIVYRTLLMLKKQFY